MIQIDDSNFAKVIADTSEPLVLIFKAEFCGPTASMEPLFDEAITRFPQIAFAEIDVEKCPKLTREMQVKGLPMLVFLNEGKPAASRVGTCDLQTLLDWLSKYIPAEG